MSLFEQLLKEYGVVAERFVKFRIPTRADAEDVLQEVYALAYQNFEQLKNKDSFKFWLLTIARNKCNDYFRKQAVKLEIPIEVLEEKQFTDSRYGVTVNNVVQETLEKLGEELSWGMYDIPSRKCNHVYDLKVTGKAKVHGIEGVELTAREASYSQKNEVINRTFVAQLTDTHCRFLASLRTDGDVRNYITFLDGEEFMPNWGFGEDNCGNETNLAPKGDIRRKGNVVTSLDKEFLLDIVGRYTVTINGKSYDTICVMDIETYNAGVVSEQFLDKNGRTILWCRFNRNDWAYDRYRKLWSEQLPENEQLIINGQIYVQWYDCITDYIL